MTLLLAVSVNGHLYIDPHSHINNNDSLAIKIQSWFYEHVPTALLKLSASKEDISSLASEVLLYWIDFAKQFLDEKRLHVASGALESAFVPFDPSEWVDFLDQAPPMLGAEYLNVHVLHSLWENLNLALTQELRIQQKTFFDYLVQFNPDWQKIGRVCFHLAENKKSLTHPFAFMATYTTGFGESNTTPQHMPLGQALKEYAGENNKSQLVNLLIPVQKASQNIEWVQDQLSSSKIFTPQPWTAKQAHKFLESVMMLEEAGLLIRVPNWWRPKSPPKAKISVSVGTENRAAINASTLLGFDLSLALPDGETLTQAEIEDILNCNDPLIQLRGQWVQVDAEKISSVLNHWKDIEKQVKQDGLTFSEGLRLLAGASKHTSITLLDDDVAQWSNVVEGHWLQETLKNLRLGEDPNSNVDETLQKYLKTNLRPYQLKGVKWLWMLYQLGLGGCLADDMGLGKTMQIISLMLLIKYQKDIKNPHLLVVPASLVANWQKEISTFAPTLKVFIAHGIAGKVDILKADDAPNFQDVDLVITTYGSVYRMPWMKNYSWDVIVLDEAQNIKNPTTKQTLSIKALKGKVRYILTGTPVENRLQDLWSLFDFCSPGLLGTSKEFSTYGKKASSAEGAKESKAFYGVVRKLVNPYILRRLKSDKSIIADLPDKTEIDTLCFLSKQQISLYQKSVAEFSERLNDINLDPMSRRGLVLSYLMRFKQICNHPSQWLGHGNWKEEESGKFIQLKNICDVIAQKQEKVLLFTQYTEIIPHLYEFMKSIFEQDGLLLHGKTPVKERQANVDKFQNSDAYPFFVLSLKAGGTGLTLTKASHVIHFDRWWNPAVENQATDRAYRIGQKKNVLVHKFICQGTLEDHINNMIISKKELAQNILGSDSQDVSLTELDNASLLNLISLDIHKATQDY